MNTTIYAPSETVKFVIEENDGGMLLDLYSGHFFGLNPTAARIWTGLAVGTSPAEIAEVLAAETGADLDTVGADVDRLVADLTDQGLIREDGKKNP